MNMVVQFLYIVFSDSRTGKVTLIICIGFYVYTLLLKKNSIVIKIKKKILDLMIAFLVCILIVLGMNVVRITYNNVVSPIISKTFFTEEEVNEEEENKENKIGREEDIKADPSNRRFSIWASGFEILKTSPIFGTGYVTFVPYAEENVPNTYVLKNDHGTFASMHNGFLNVLVYQGILGFIIYILFAICTAVKILKSIWKLEGEQYRFGIAMLSCVAAIVCSMMFLLEGTYTNSIGSIVLWCNLGWLVCLVDKKNKTTYSS